MLRSIVSFLLLLQASAFTQPRPHSFRSSEATSLELQRLVDAVKDAISPNNNDRYYGGRYDTQYNRRNRNINNNFNRSNNNNSYNPNRQRRNYNYNNQYNNLKSTGNDRYFLPEENSPYSRQRGFSQGPDYRNSRSSWEDSPYVRRDREYRQSPPDSSRSRLSYENAPNRYSGGYYDYDYDY